MAASRTCSRLWSSSGFCPPPDPTPAMCSDRSTGSSRSGLPSCSALVHGIPTTTIARPSAACMPPKKPSSPKSIWAKGCNATSSSWTCAPSAKASSSITTERKSSVCAISVLACRTSRKSLKRGTSLSNISPKTTKSSPGNTTWSSYRSASSPPKMSKCWPNDSGWR